MSHITFNVGMFSLSGIIKKYEKLVLEGVGSDPASTFSATGLTSFTVAS